MSRGGSSKFLFDRWLPKILSLLAAVLLSLFYQINNLQERFFSVPLAIETDDSFSVTGDVPLYVRVHLRGTEEQIFSIMEDEIAAVADFSSHDSEGTFKVPIQIQMKKQVQPLDETLEIQVEPREITIFQEEKVIRSLEIRPVLTGFPPNGYELVQYFMSPSSVTVQGPRSQLEDIHSISTEEIPLAGRYDDFTVSTRLVPPGRNVYIPGGDIVEFRGVVDEAIIVQSLTSLEIVTVDLSSGLYISEALPEMSMTIQGSQLQLEQLRPRDFHFFLDCSNITVPGTYTLPIQVDVPSGVAVLKYFPREVPVTFGRNRESDS